MTAAIIGFIGVIAGSLITAWFNRRSERDRRRDEAALAARLISGELDAAARKVAAYAKTGRWGEERLSTERWARHGAALSAELDDEDGQLLARAYSGIESRERERAQQPNARIAEGKVEKLKRESVALRHRAKAVKNSIAAPLSARFSGIALNVGLAVLCAGVLVLVIAAFIPRPEMTDVSIASALADKLHGERYVACSHNADRWHCDVAYAPQSCPAATPLRQPEALLAVAGDTAQKGVRCGSGPGPRSPPGEFEVADGAQGVLAMESPDELVADEDLEALLLDVGDSSEVERAVEELFGSD